MIRCWWIPMLAVGFIAMAQSSRADEGDAPPRIAQERIEAIAREANELQQQGKQEQAEQLMAKVRQLREGLEQDKSERDKSPELREAIQKRLAQLQDALAEARKKGLQDRVADLERAIAEITKDLAKRTGDVTKQRLEIMEKKILSLREQGKAELAEKMLQQLHRHSNRSRNSRRRVANQSVDPDRKRPMPPCNRDWNVWNVRFTTSMNRASMSRPSNSNKTWNEHVMRARSSNVRIANRHAAAPVRKIENAMSSSNDSSTSTWPPNISAQSGCTISLNDWSRRVKR